MKKISKPYFIDKLFFFKKGETRYFNVYSPIAWGLFIIGGLISGLVAFCKEIQEFTESTFWTWKHK
jgi:hypothetical protein